MFLNNFKNTLGHLCAVAVFLIGLVTLVFTGAFVSVLLEDLARWNWKRGLK